MKIAMIGTGGIAARHLEVLSVEPGVEIVAHVSPTPGHAAAAASRWGGRADGEVGLMLEHMAADAAWVCIPPAAHGLAEEMLIDRGIPFLVEKPLSVDRATPEKIARAVKERGLIVAAGYPGRAMDTLEAVRARLAAEPARMIAGRWYGPTPGPAWWRHRATGGGQMLEQVTHLFDLARFLAGDATVLAAHAGRHPRPAFPDADVADVSAALLRFESGAAGVFSASCLLRASAVIELQLICEGVLITVTRQGVAYDTGLERTEIRSLNDPFVAEDRAFLRAVRENNPGLLFCDYLDALRTHTLCMDVAEAAP